MPQFGPACVIPLVALSAGIRQIADLPRLPALASSTNVIVRRRLKVRKKVSYRTCALFVILAFVSGCSAVQQTYGIPATDLSWIRFDMTRSDIEERLGQPQDTRSLQAVYEFNRGYAPPARDNPIMWPPAAVGWELLNLLSLGTQSASDLACQRARLYLTYNSSRHLVAARQALVDLGRRIEGFCNRIRANLELSTLQPEFGDSFMSHPWICSLRTTATPVLEAPKAGAKILSHLNEADTTVPVIAAVDEFVQIALPTNGWIGKSAITGCSNQPPLW